MSIEQEIKSHLHEIEMELQNLTRLFGIPDTVWLQPDTYRYTLWQDPARACFVCTFHSKTHSVKRESPIPEVLNDERLDALHRRRAVRRLCRQTFYDLLKAETGLRPPWGSLTGIRPTRLIYEQLEHGSTLDEAAQNLTDLYDVTPEKAELLREVVETQQLLPPTDDKWIDVYIGIPFCTTRCAYCSFSSGEIGNGRLVEPYLDALFQELRAGMDLLRESGHQLRALYIGGGTPTSLNEDQFARFLDEVNRCFTDVSEFTVEAGRPDTITPGKLRLIREAGAGRISINPQTMNDRTLQLIGRAHTAQQTVDAYAMARAEGIHHINMDVIAGLPGESLDDFAHTMSAARELKPESLTIHALAIKRSTRMHLEGTALPEPETASRMTAMGLETAHQLGMKAYYLYRQKAMAGAQENVGCALPGHACLYNVDIMEEQTHILAFGAGGISKRVYPGEGQLRRAPNVSNIELYIARVQEMIQRKRDLFLDR